MSSAAEKELNKARADCQGPMIPNDGTSTGETQTMVDEPQLQAQPVNGDSPGRSATASRSPKQHRTCVGRRVTARPSPHQSSNSLNWLSSQINSLNFDTVIQGDDDPEIRHHSSDENPYAQRSLLAQVLDWLQQEKARSVARASKRTGGSQGPLPGITTGETASALTRERSDSQASEGMLALEKLEQILAQYAATGKEGISSSRIGRKRSSSLKLRASIRGLKQGSTSDSDYSDADLPPPSADVVLDNSKTVFYGGSEADNDFGNKNSSNGVSTKSKEHWLKFKYEIVRLTHTLSLKGWRRIPLEDCGNIEVVRLSGALTNAVYVVSPPKQLPPASDSSTSSSLMPRSPPPQLLLRIYGPQVEHLIDRESELQILRRLGKRNIGPRVLGTFKNGRFEQYFRAKTLTPRDIRNPETSEQIAKRMRELHEGIELLSEEREGGPFLWKNWDKWLERCEHVASWLDSEINSPLNESKIEAEPWRRLGFICGAPWPKFRKLVESYRNWLDTCYGGASEINKQLVFAHNDTQYGNLLRLEPSGESPLLLPANKHKQLVVIDFEYASANPRGLEFCNHFTEWCYNYHDPERPWACNTKWYPTPEEQERFIRAYLTHRPHIFHPPETRVTQSALSSATISVSASSSPAPTPAFQASHSNSPRISPFTLDTQVPPIPTSSALDHERAEQAPDLEVRRLLRETRLWRAANSAQWVAWGIVQAKISGMEEAHSPSSATSEEQPVLGKGAGETPAGDTTELDRKREQPSDTVNEPAGEFDYLAYAQDRALFFWADILSLGLIKEGDLPPDMAERIKGHIIGY
ncbi:choline kinase [Histoplasma capsulatum var. duboisii H88]|uniref:Choline kinase n=1 Tax=Ajellomyces capsulatus (strain H88) TaxID=544711 RepID=A0A8A1LQR0_AJEC8|nr:choline kinase [Histoplasma capsulatum var. duboisii H88]